jgi:mannose-6-phosphate isomerase-like protein (cupin superfamily)
VIETSDAVLVASKEHAQNVKQVVARLAEAKRTEHFSHDRVYRPWGHYESVDAGPGYQVKRIVVSPGQALSLQRHRRRAEHWIVVSGTARVTCDERVFDLGANQSTFIPLGAKHRLENACVDASAADRGAIGRLPRRGRHRAVRGSLPARMSAITLSVVSHGQNALVNQLLGDLARLARPGLSIVVTQNVPDRDPLDAPPGALRSSPTSGRKGLAPITMPPLLVSTPRTSVSPIPTCGFPKTRFQRLISALEGGGVVGPACAIRGAAPRTARVAFRPSSSLLRKLISGASGPDYPVDDGPQRVDWVAGMFMLFRSEAFRAVGGFDERFFLYYEDVDVCRRMRALGYSAVYVPDATVIHDARRESRRNPRLMGIHAASALRYLARRYR